MKYTNQILKFRLFFLAVLLFTAQNALSMQYAFSSIFYPWILFYNVLFKNKNNQDSPSVKIKQQYLSLVKGPMHLPKTFPIRDPKTIETRIAEYVLEESIAFCPLKLKYAMDNRDKSIRFFDTNQSRQPCVTRLLLHGPSWNGKTTLAFSLAHKYKNHFAYLCSAELYDSYDEGYIDIIDSLLDPLTRDNKPAIIILESIHILCRKEKIEDYPDKEAAQYLLQKLKFANILNPHLLIVGITHALDELSHDYKEYFENDTYQINPPSNDKRKIVIENFLFRNGFFDKEIIKKLTYETRNLPLGHIDSALQQARFKATLDAAIDKRPRKRLTLENITKGFSPFLKNP